MKSEFPFSHRTNWRLNANPLSVALTSLREKNIPVVDLTESNPTCCGFQYPQEKILSSLADPRNLLYSPCASGSLEARGAVSDYYRRKGFKVDPKHIVLTASASEAYSYIFRLLLNPDDQVLVGRPSYPLFEFLAELNDARMERYFLIYDDGKGGGGAASRRKSSKAAPPLACAQAKWRIDLQALEKAISPKTGAVILVNPNNPTGSFVTQEELSVINQLCLKHHMALISDEVFSDYAFKENSQNVSSLVSNSEVLSFSLGGISKCLGLPQMKCGWIVASGPPNLVDQALARLEIIADTYLSVNTPVQNALSQWLGWQEDISREIRDRLKQNWGSLKGLRHDGKTLLGNSSPHVLNCEGGWYAVLKLPSGKYSEEEWVMEFLQKDHVFVHPGYFFDFQEEPFIVLSLLPQPETFKLGLDQILRRINLLKE